MNYIQLINNFWFINREIGFNAHDTQVYFYLLNESNRANWKNPIYVSTNILTAELKISRKTLVTVREKLSKHGLINFQEGIKNKIRASYEILYVSTGNINVNIKGNINGNIEGNMNGNIEGNHFNKTKHKPNKTIKENKFSIPEINQVKEFFLNNGSNELVAERFFDYYESNGWMVGKNKMKKWEAAAKNWIKREDSNNKTTGKPSEIKQAISIYGSLMEDLNNEYPEEASQYYQK